MGQILTYAAGLKVSGIIWISKQFTEEHRAVLDWLNENTGGNIHFFGIEMELWKIGDSLPAPIFKVVAQPTDWSNKITQASKSVTLSTTEKLQEAYWNALVATGWLDMFRRSIHVVFMRMKT